MQRVPSAVRHEYAAGVNHGKTCKGLQARENMQRVLSAGKKQTAEKRYDFILILIG